MLGALLTLSDHPKITLVVGTAHLQSVFFSTQSSDTKCSQLTYSTNTLESLNADCLVFMCDCNLEGGSQLNNQNTCISRSGLTDGWKALRGTSDDYNDVSYRINDVTWNGAENPKIGGIREYHRPDRIFYKCNGNDIHLRLVNIERIVNNLSDHYGLIATFLMTKL